MVSIKTVNCDFLFNATLLPRFAIKSKIIFIEILHEIYQQTQVQLNNYIKSNLTTGIQENNKINKFATENLIQHMYNKLAKGMSGISFIETFYGLKFEKFLQEEAPKLIDEPPLDLNYFLRATSEIDMDESNLAHSHSNSSSHLLLPFQN